MTALTPSPTIAELTSELALGLIEGLKTIIKGHSTAIEGHSKSVLYSTYNLI